MAGLVGSLQAVGVAGRRAIPFMELISGALGGLSCSGGTVLAPTRFVSALCGSYLMNLSGVPRVFSTTTLDVGWVSPGIKAFSPDLDSTGQKAFILHGIVLSTLQKGAASQYLANDPLHEFVRYVKFFTTCASTMGFSSQPALGLVHFVKALSSGASTMGFSSQPALGLVHFVKALSSGSFRLDLACPVSPFPPLSISFGASSGCSIVLFLGTVGGILLFSSKSSQNEQCNDPYGLNDDIPDGNDPVKEILKLLKKMASKFSKFPDPVVKLKAWYVETLENCLGQNGATHLLAAARYLRERWSEFYLVILTAGTCWRLDINLFQGFEIVAIIISETCDEMKEKLESYLRKANRKKGEGDVAEVTIAYAAFDLTTKQVYQMVMLSTEVDEAIIRGLLKDIQKKQPSLPGSIHPGLLALLRGHEEASLLHFLGSLTKQDERPSPPTRRPKLSVASKREKDSPDGKLQKPAPSKPTPSIPWRIGS